MLSFVFCNQCAIINLNLYIPRKYKRLMGYSLIYQPKVLLNHVVFTSKDISLFHLRLFRQLWVFVSLLSNIFIDDFSARQYKNCVRILKGSYIVMKCSDNKV